MKKSLIRQRNYYKLSSNFNNFFTEIGPKLANEIKTPAKIFEVYLKQVNILQHKYPLSINKQKPRS